MNGQTQDLTSLSLQDNEEYATLAAQHHQLDDRLHELSTKTHPTEPELLEESTLKKRKLQVKDRMQAIARDFQAHH